MELPVFLLENILSRKSDLEKYRKFFEGDGAAIYSEFKSRYLSTDVATADKFPLRDFVYQNNIRFIQNERVNFIPVEFEVSASRVGGDKPDEALTEEVLAWLDEPFFGGEKTFWEALQGYYLTRENFGDLFLKLYVEDGDVKAQKMFSEDVTILCDEADVRNITGYVFEWEQTVDVGEDNEQDVIMREEIDSTSYKVYQEGVLIEDESHSFGFIPVVKITREEQDGIRYGRSGIEDLIEPQVAINMVLTKRAWATKHNSFRVWAPKVSGEVNDNTPIKISPGSVCSFPIEAVGGDIDLSCLENELKEYKSHLFQLGSVPNPEKSEGMNTNISAVALNKMLEPLRKYTRGKLPYLRKGFSELIEKAFKIDGKEISVSITYPNLEMEDRALLIQEAKFWSENGFEEKALKIMGVDETERKEMEQDREKTQEERDQRAQEFQDKMINRGDMEVEEDDQNRE